MSLVLQGSITDKHGSIEKLILKGKLAVNALRSLQTTDVYSCNSHFVPMLHTAITLAVLLLFCVSYKERLFVKGQHLLIKCIDFCYLLSDQRICSWHQANLVYQGKKWKGKQPAPLLFKTASCWKRNPHQGIRCPRG